MLSPPTSSGSDAGELVADGDGGDLPCILAGVAIDPTGGWDWVASGPE